MIRDVKPRGAVSPATSKTVTTKTAATTPAARPVDVAAAANEAAARGHAARHLVADAASTPHAAEGRPLDRGGGKFGAMGLLLAERTAKKGPALTPGQARAVAMLEARRPATPAPLFLLTDPNKDPDDLSVMILLKKLAGSGFVDVKAAVTTLGDRETRTTRARFAKSVFDQLDLPNVKVGVGVDYALEVRDLAGVIDEKATKGRQADHAKFMDTPLLNESAHIEQDGLGLLQEGLRGCADHTAVLVVNAGMADAAALLRADPQLVQQKVARVIIMGGVDAAPDADGHLRADARAYNNTTHQPSADFVYKRVQELGVAVVVVAKEAAYAGAAPKDFYEGMAATGHAVGTYLRDQQHGALHHLWDGIHAGHLPPALNVEWFAKTFTDVDPATADGRAVVDALSDAPADFDAVWGRVTKFNLYDPLALLAAIPAASDMVFTPVKNAGVTSDAQVVGAAGVKDASLVRDLMAGLGISALSRP